MEDEVSDPSESALVEPPSDRGRPAWLRRWTTIRSSPSPWEKAGLGLACIGLVLLLWALLTAGEGDARIIDAYTMPSPAEAAASLPELWFERALSRSAVASLTRVLSGFLLAAAIAVPAGVLAASYPRLEAFLRPLSVFGRNIPIAALIPLTFMWFGLYEIQKIMFIFLASVAFIFFDTIGAVSSVSNRFLDTAYTLGAKSVPRRGALRTIGVALLYGLVAVAFWAYVVTDGDGMLKALASWQPWVAGIVGALIGFLLWFPIQSNQVVQKVLFPLALPRIVNSLRLLFGLAFGYIMLAEVVAAKAGLGMLIINSQRIGPREHVYPLLIIIALLAFGIDRLVYFLQRRWFPYEVNAQH